MTAKSASRSKKSVPKNASAQPTKVSTVERVIDRFKELLYNGDLKPGDRLPNETELANSFGTSRGSIREAVKTLASFGILRVKWGSGTYVASSISESAFDHKMFQLLVSKKDKKNLLELREVMESGIAQLAAQNANKKDLAEINRLHRKMESIIIAGETDPETLARVDAEFHASLAKATHNPLLERLYTFAMELYFPSMVKTHINRSEDILQSPRLHQEIVDAVCNADGSAAADAAKQSLKVWYDLL